MSPLFRRLAVMLGLALLLGAPSAFAAEAPEVHSVSFLSKPYEVDRIYKSMMGPSGRSKIRLREGPSELLWITGYRAEIVGPGSAEPVSPEFMCHSNLGFANMPRHRKLFHWLEPKKRSVLVSRPRLFTLSQGQMDIRFPSGYGVAVLSDEVFNLDTQVLNLNQQQAELQVQHKTTIDYVRDQELKKPMKPLFQQAAQGLVLVSGQDGYFKVKQANAEEHGEGCMVGVAAAGGTIKDGMGRQFSGHWKVPPGREVNHTLVTESLNLPFDTTVHHIAVHLHPFAESLELRDLTTGETLFKSEARGPLMQIGLEHVDYYSSEAGLSVFADHQYELVSVYDNTSDEAQDSMAVMFLYMHDQEFIRPAIP